MPNRVFELRDVQRDGIRTACAAIDQALADLPATEAPALRARWAELVTVLALEPARVLRECPACRHVAMFEATRCLHCWAKLPVATVNDVLAASPPIAPR